MKNYLQKIVLAMIFAVCSNNGNATDAYIGNLSIQWIRNVGDYSTGTVYDNTIELWFTTPVTFPANLNCPTTYRVYIDSKNKHLVAAAYLAYVNNMKVGINADSNLPIRQGACELSFLDITK